jgi:hypothetical protein
MKRQRGFYQDRIHEAEAIEREAIALAEIGLMGQARKVKATADSIRNDARIMAIGDAHHGR